jgi:hypothetical protein
VIADILLHGTSGATLSGDALAIGLASYTSGTGPLLGWWQAAGHFAATPEIAGMLADHLRHNTARAAKLAAAAQLVTGQLQVAAIPVRLLKGAHTGGAYFPNAATRPAADIDMLVPASDFARAEAILRQAGMQLAGRGRWESSWRQAGASDQPRSLWLVHRDDPWTIDLHSSLNVRAATSPIIAVLDRALPFEHAATGLDQPLLLLHLACHAGAGMHNLTLLRLVELRLAIMRDRASGALVWPAFVALATQTGALGLAWPALALCERLVPGTVPHNVLAACAQDAPPGVHRLVERLQPATAQRIDRSSLAEHFMWTTGCRGVLGQLAGDLLPGKHWRDHAAIHARRLHQLLSGRVSR